MTAKEFLRQYGNCERRIQSLQRRIQRLREQAESITQAFSEQVQSSGVGDNQARIIETYVDMEMELEQEIQAYRKIRKQVENAINMLEDNRQRDVLERYYLEGMTFEQVAADLHYSFRQTLRHHGIALLKIKDVIECHISSVL